MHNSQSLESEPLTADNSWVWKLRPVPVEDPIPNPEPEVPSLGYPDLGVFHHALCVLIGHSNGAKSGANSLR